MMCNVLTYEQIDRNEWSRLVASSSTGTWFQTPEAYDFFASQPKLFKPFVVAISNDASLSEAQHSINSSLQTLRAVCIGYVTVEKNPIKQFFTRRAIIIGGPCLADDCTAEEVNALLCAVKSTLLSGRDGVGFRPIYIETRNFNDYSRWKEVFKKARFEYVPHLNFHVNCVDKEAMDGKLSENRKRQIKKAVKSGIEISEAQCEQEINEWYEILLHLYKTRVKTPLFPLSFFIEFYRHGFGKYLLVKYEGKVIGGIMCPILNGKCIYEWFVCGMDTVYRSQNPSVMATYAAMEFGNAHGLARFDFMGAGKPNEPYGVREFKARFGGDEVEHGRFLCITKPILYIIGTLGVKILKKLK